MKALHMKGPIGWLLASIAMPLLSLNKINKYSYKYRDYQGPEFSKKVLRQVGVRYQLDPNQFDYIPKEGAFITISNHHIGSIDGLMLSAIVGTMRPDYKLLTNFILTMLPSLKDSFFPVNPFSSGVSKRSSLQGLKMSMEHLAAGGALGLFPAGEVATYQPSSKKTAKGKHIIEDTVWPTSMIKLIKDAGVPVVPIYFECYNSKFFYFLGRIHPILRTAWLVRELFNKRGQRIPVRIGRPITPDELNEYDNLEQLGGYLRSRVYAMESEFVNSNKVNAAAPENMLPLAIPRDKKAVLKEMAKLRENGNMLFQLSDYQCYLASTQDIPITLIEIGRRREEAFRATGEGTNNDIDTDEYDNYYKHLVLWDFRNKRIAGAYRIGIGSEIFENHGGIKGFYSSSLFNYSEQFAEEYLKNAIELGRSFVALDYQKEALPLMLLLKGLVLMLMRYPDAKYLFGPVSISNSYPKFYQSLMVHYISEKYSADIPDGMATPTTPFTPENLHIIPQDLLRRKMDSLEKFDKFIMRLSDGKYRMPTLVKKYFKINVRIICFNVDPLFNYSLDGLILLKLSDYPKSDLLSMIRDVENPLEKEAILNRFGYSNKN